MRREVTLEEISDGKLYGANDMVKADCQDCVGCWDCCLGMGESIVLDPLDVHRLCVNLGKSMEELLSREISLGVMDGNILPYLNMTGAEERCVFLNQEGRCSIHPFRPGICRLFPLGRFYEERGHQYFLQVHECKKQNRSKIKVKKWIDVPDVKRYEAFVDDWHYFLKDVQEILYQTEDTEKIRDLNLYVVKRFYLMSYDREQDFYPQFYERLGEGKEILEEERAKLHA